MQSTSAAMPPSIRRRFAPELFEARAPHIPRRAESVTRINNFIVRKIAEAREAHRVTIWSAGAQFRRR
jgi:hypothetical protein